MADEDLTYSVRGAREAARSMRLKARYIRLELPKEVRQIGNMGQLAARTYARRPSRKRGANVLGERTGNLVRAIQSGKPVKTPNGWEVTLTTVTLPNPAKDVLGRRTQPEDYVGFVEEGTEMKVIKRGNLMVFPESRPGFPFGFWGSHVFRGQQGKHMFRDAARDINTRHAPQRLRDFGRRIGNL